MNKMFAKCKGSIYRIRIGTGLMNQAPTHKTKRILCCAFLLTLFFSLIFCWGSQCAIVEKITIEGNNYFSFDEIKDQMTIKENRWYNIFKKRSFHLWKIEMDEYIIDSLYHSSGFLEEKSKIDYELKGENKDKAYLLVKIDEGVQTRLKSISVSGGLDELDRYVRRILSDLKADEIVNPYKFEKAKFDIKTVYANNGYPYAEIEMKMDRTSSESGSTSSQEGKKWAEVSYLIASGPLVNFGDVYLKGFNRTKQKVAQRELTLKKGDLYSRAKILDSQQRLYSTQLFSYISLDAQDALEKPLNPNFVLRVTERKPSFVGFRTGISQYQPPNLTADLTTWDLTAEWGNRNLWGTGRKISLSAFSSFEISKYYQNLNNRFTLKFIEPWFLGKRILFDVDFYYEPGIKSILQEYKIESYGGNADFSKEFSRFTKGWLTFSYQVVNIFDVPKEKVEDIKKELGINVRRKLILSGEKDTRGNIFIPLSGSFTQIYAEQVGWFLGGDNHFFKSIFSWCRYNRLGKPGVLNVLATRIKLGYIERLKKTEYVPTYDRFYIGGATTVRGYAENSLGPKDSEGNPLGGKVMLIGNIEWRRELFWKFGYTLFADAGNLWSETKEVNPKDLKLTAGLGLEFFTPVGPLRLDYGQRIIRGEDPKGGEVHFSILYAF
jgi:outer membrane protein insertion porin family